jgi:anti-sigma-K factor RskA
MGAENDLVQRYFDGELAADERARFESSMTDDDRERLAVLAEMRALLSGALDAEAAQVDIWSGVAAALKAPAERAEPAADKQRRVRRWRERVRTRSTAGAAMLVAAAAALLFFVHPWHPSHPGDDCDVEVLEVEGAQATVLRMHDSPHSGDGTTTIIWSEED